MQGVGRRRVTTGADRAAALASGTRHSRRPPPLVPHQHGAWAFLALPMALGATTTGWSPVLLLLVPAWIAAYPLSWALGELLSARRPERYRRAVVVWSSIFVPFGVALAALRPWLLVAGLGYAVLLAVNIGFARAGAERSLANDLLLVFECTLMVPLLVAVVDQDNRLEAVRTTEVAVLSVVCATTLIGSTLHVKSLIRERRNRVFTDLSRTFALVCVPVASLLALAWGSGGWWLVPPFGLLAVRAWVPALRTWRPARIGLVELVGFLAVAAGAWLAS